MLIISLSRLLARFLARLLMRFLTRKSRKDKRNLQITNSNREESRTNEENIENILIEKLGK